MTRIVTYAHRYKRPPRKRKAVALEAPAVVTAKSSRRLSLGGRAAAEVRAALPPFREEGAAQPSTLRQAERVATPANDDRKPAVVRNEPKLLSSPDVRPLCKGSLAGPVYRGYLRASSLLMRRPSISTISKRQPS